MSPFQDLPVTIGATIRHEDDFTFPKLKEELAVKIRSEYLPKIRDVWKSSYAGVSFDDDGDIKIYTDKGSLYVTQNYVHLSTRIERIALISEVNSLGIISAVLGELFRARSSFQAEEYIIIRSEEHTSELQSRLHLVCPLLL